MINSALYKQPELLDSQLHRHKKIKHLTDFSVAKAMHAVFLTATEFPHAALDLPIIFIHTGERIAGDKAMVSPVALMGLTANENLRITPDGRWDARYLPAFIRRFPFLTAGLKDSDHPGVFIETAWPGFNDEEGDALFTDKGEPTEALKTALEFLQRFDDEARRTRLFCERLVQLDLLREMHADAAMPGGENVKVEGFLIIDEEKLGKLPDAVALELVRNGMLMLIHAHLISLPNIRDLAHRKAQRMVPAAPAAS